MATPRIRLFTPRAATATLLLAAPIGLVVSGGYQLIYRRLDFPLPSEVPTALASLVVLLALVSSAAAWWSGRRCAITAAGLVSPAVISTAIQSSLLTETPFYINGLGGDQMFRTSFLTKFTATPHLVDAVYADLPTYYSPGWFWVGGRAADIVGVAGWEWYKPWSILTMAVAASLSYALWAMVLRPRTALPLALATALVGLHLGAYSPYSWILAATAPPLAVLAARAITRWLRDGQPRLGNAVWFGVYLGVAALVHTLFLGLAGIFLLLVTITVAARHRDHWHIRTLATAAVVAAIPAALIAALQWAPYFLARGHLPKDSSATEFLPDIGAQLPISVFNPGPIGILSALGVAWLVWRCGRDPVARALALLAATCVTWYVASFALSLTGSTLLPFRAEPVLMLALVVAGLLALRDAVATLRTARKESTDRIRIQALVTAFALLAAIGLANSVRNVEPGWNNAAANTVTPSGMIAPGTELARPGDVPYTTDELVAAVSEATGGKPPLDVVALSADPHLLAVAPYFGFQALGSAYANPKAGYATRNDLIQHWSTATDGGQLTQMLDESPVRAPDVFVLSDTPHGWDYGLSVSTLPRSTNSHWLPVTFRPEAFDAEHFRVLRVGNMVIAARI